MTIKHKTKHILRIKLTKNNLNILKRKILQAEKLIKEIENFKIIVDGEMTEEKKK